MIKSTASADRWARIGVLALMTALSSLCIVSVPAQAQAPLPPVECNAGVDSYTFTPGLRLLPQNTNFVGQGETRNLCPLGGPNGSTTVLMKKASMGNGDLACTVNAFVTGQLKFEWLVNETTVVARSTVELTLMQIAGATKEVEMRGIVTEGALDGSLMVLSYTSTADTRECLTPNGLNIVPGVTKSLIFS
jgi:hypothetical protein